MSQPVSLHSESTDFDSSVRGSGPPVRSTSHRVQNKQTYFPQSPITFAPILDHRFPLQLEEALDFGAAPLEEADAAAQPEVRKEDPPQKYSPIVQMGLFLLVQYLVHSKCYCHRSDITSLQQMTRGLDRAIEGVKLKLRKPKEPEV
jgi:hypothetical protein